MACVLQEPIDPCKPKPAEMCCPMIGTMPSVGCGQTYPPCIFVGMASPPPPPEIKAVPICRPKCNNCDDEKDPCARCEDYTVAFKKKKKDEGCPYGYKPCTLALHPPCNGSPFGTWKAEVIKCPKKYKPLENVQHIPPCCNPCCLHWKPPAPCLYDKPCKAHCFNHPPGIKPSSERSC